MPTSAPNWTGSLKPEVGHTDLVRNSRDGDQFHYTWAARQSLRLLDLNTNFRCMFIEGASPADSLAKTGEESIDLSEYWGGESLENADNVVYRQLKHSSVRTHQPWVASELTSTFEGFARWYFDAVKQHPEVADRIRFEIVTNRPCSNSLKEALDWLRSPSPGSKPNRAVETLRAALPANITSDAGQFFFRLIAIDDAAPALLQLRNVYETDLGDYIPGFVGDLAVLLREAVSIRATNLPGAKEPLTREVVMQALKTSEVELFPAPNRIPRPHKLIPTHQVPHLRARVLAARKATVIHASGGVGKSALTYALADDLPRGSLAITYDCFGNGEYRRQSGPRHEARQAVIQIANELAGRGLCNPLLPGPAVTASQYARALVQRLNQAAEALVANNPDALILLCIDAADNAVLAAQEFNDTAFVNGFLREGLHPHVRLAVLCRSERRQLLDIPPEADQIELLPFNLDETRLHILALEDESRPAGQGHAAVLKKRDVETFYRVTGGYPRVQRAAFADADDLQDAIAVLATVKRSADPLSGLLRRAVDQAADASHQSKHEVERICRCLATLRPLIPIPVLAHLAGVEPSAVRSFVADVGRGITIDGESVQFIDEPTETWFRENYHPSGDDINRFIESLLPFAKQYPYIAATVPSLMWEAKLFDELVDLAASDDGLPDRHDGSGVVQMKEIASQRALFALKGALTLRRDEQAARLAVRVGELAAGNSRRINLMRANTDLTGLFLDPTVQERLIATRSLSDGWSGSNLIYEASLLAQLANSRPLARLRWASAATRAKDWARRMKDAPEEVTRGQHHLTVENVAELTWAKTQLDGGRQGAVHLAMWRPPEARFLAGLSVCRRLADHARWKDLVDFAKARQESPWVQLAVATACWEANHVLPPEATKTVLRPLNRRKTRLTVKKWVGRDEEHAVLAGLLWAVACGVRHGLIDAAEASRLLRLHLPDDLGHRSGERFESDTSLMLFGFALLATVEGRTFEVESVAGEECRADAAKPHVRSRDRDSFVANIVPLAPIVSTFARLIIDEHASCDESQLHDWIKLASTKRSYDSDRIAFLTRERTRILGRILCLRNVRNVSTTKFADRVISADEPYTVILTDIVRWFARRPALVESALAIAEVAGKRVVESNEQAEKKINDLVILSRATLPLGLDEANAYFDDAVSISERLGDDADDRWRLLCRIARLTSAESPAASRRARQLARVCEELAAFLYEGPDPGMTLQLVSRMSRATCFDVASEWRDRRFARMDSIANALTQNGPDDPAILEDRGRLALALLPFLDHTAVVPMLRRVIEQEPGLASLVTRATAEYCHHMAFTPASTAELLSELNALGISVEGTAFCPPPGRVDCFGAPDIDGYSPPSRDWAGSDSTHSQESEWLSEIDLTNPQGWVETRTRAAREHRYIPPEVVAHAALRAERTKQSAAIRALMSTSPDHWELNALLKASAKVQLSRGARTALTELGRQVMESDARGILLVPYDAVDLSALRSLTGGELDLVRYALDSLGRDPGLYSAEEAFALAGHIAKRLNATQNERLYDQCLALFEHICDATSDPVGGELTDPEHLIDNGLARLLWGALGDASIRTRWQAAHAAVMVCTMHCDRVLVELNSLATGDAQRGEFHDPELKFYELHARQWLLLAVSRAVQDPATARSIATFAPLLRHAALEAQNIVWQHAATSTLTALRSCGWTGVSEREVGEATARLTPVRVIDGNRYSDEPNSVDSFEAVTSLAKTLSGSHESRGRRKRNKAASSRQKTHRGMVMSDFVEYWCKPLGVAFGLDQESIWTLVQEVRGSAAAPAEDPRRVRGVYSESTYLYKSERPEEDDLELYLDLHALYEVASRLLTVLPVLRDSEYHGESSDNEFDDFLANHVPKRRDGRWLADRKDPTPPSSTRRTLTRNGADSGTSTARVPHWAEAIADADLDSALESAPGWLVLQEVRYERGFSRSQNTFVESVLAPRDTAQALLRAMQTAPNFNWFPAINDWHPRDSKVPAQYRVTHWMTTPDGGDQSIDSFDALAQGIEFPPARPSREVQSVLRLTADEDMRVWRDVDGAEVIWVWEWQDLDDRRNERGSHGYRVALALDQLPRILEKFGKCLVVSVRIKRDEKNHSGESKSRRNHVEPAFRFYLHDVDGSRRTG